MIHLTIDNHPIQVHEDRTILEACREHGFPIPTLCYHPALEPYGACRLCMVEIYQPPRPARLVASCTYPCEAGLQVLTNSEPVKRSRRMTAELLLAGVRASSTGSSSTGSNSVGYNSVGYNSVGYNREIQQLAEELGVREVRFHLPEEDICVLCGMCVRACREIVGANAISFIQRGILKKVSPPFKISSAACIGCGTCTLICPTGAIRLTKVTGIDPTLAVHGPMADLNPHYCRLCGVSDLTVHYLQDLESSPPTLLTKSHESRLAQEAQR
jgi:bidirectional [NiFe] hydrogenase diaphorase subunit